MAVDRAFALEERIAALRQQAGGRGVSAAEKVRIGEELQQLFKQRSEAENTGGPAAQRDGRAPWWRGGRR